MKWVTAYAMDELVKGIQENQKEALKNNPVLPQMTPEEIDAQLTLAAHTKRAVSIQLNLKDKWGRQTDSITGDFLGYLPGGKIKIGKLWLALADVRHVSVRNDGKWFRVTPFPKPSDDFQVAEPEVQLVDDYSQDDEWLE